LPVECLDHFQLQQVMIPLIMKLADKNNPCLPQVCHHPGDSSLVGTLQPERCAAAGGQQD
jgi:hypothetical protein